MASRCVFSTAVAYALSKVGKEGLVLKKEQLQTIRNLYNILSLLDSCTEQFYGTCTEIFHACANSVYQASPFFWEGPGYEARSVYIHDNQARQRYTPRTAFSFFKEKTALGNP